MLRSLAVFVLGLAWLGFGASSSAAPTDLIPETTAAQYGLTRPWFAQIELTGSRARVQDMVLYEDALYVQTTGAMLHALDAQTGKTLWTRQVGDPRFPSMTPGLNRDWLVTINGSRLYVCNRFNGNLLHEFKIKGTPSAGPAVSDKRAYVPMINGLVLAYSLTASEDPNSVAGTDQASRTKPSTPEEKADAEAQRRVTIRVNQDHAPPLTCQSFGRALIQPMVIRQNDAEEMVMWPTDRGHLNIGRIDRVQPDRFGVKARLETDGAISAPPTYLPPDPQVAGDSGLVFTVSEDGFVYAILEKNARLFWRFSTGESIVQPAVVIEEQVYVATQLGGMHCLNAKTGAEIWFAPQVTQFIAASIDRVYVVDTLGQILILNAKTGSRLATLPLRRTSRKLINMDTDRIYLASDTGLVQCVHEPAHVQPIRHGEARKKAAQQASTGDDTAASPGAKPKLPPSKNGVAKPKSPAKPAAEPADDDGADPFAGDAADATPVPAKKPAPKKPSSTGKRPPAKKPSAKKPAPGTEPADEEPASSS